MKKIIVASFQRSGTHFLINNMATNFENVENGWTDIIHGRANQWVSDVQKRNLGEKIALQLDLYSQSSIRKCLKTHYQMYFFEPYLDEIVKKYDILYIVRDPRDTMVACFNYYNNTNFEAFVKEPVFGKFLRMELWNVRTETQPFSYSYVKPRNIVDKWDKHVLSWLRYRGRGICFVKFSDLKFRFQETLKRMESETGQRMKSIVQEVLLEDTRYRPDFRADGIRRGTVGSWKAFFSTEDLQFLSDSLSEASKQFIDE